MTDMRSVTWLATCRRCYWSLVCSGISPQRGSCEWLAHSKRDGLSTSPSCEQDTDLQGRWRYPAALSVSGSSAKLKGGQRIIPEPRYFSMPSTVVGAAALRNEALNWTPWVRSLTHAPLAWTNSPAEIIAA